MTSVQLRLLAQFRTYHYRREAEEFTAPETQITVKELIDLVYKHDSTISKIPRRKID